MSDEKTVDTQPMEVVEKKKFDFPTEIVELPSKGLLYPKSNPLSSGKIEMKYMTAKEEDILTNQNYIRQGVVLDKLMQALIVSKINYDDLVVGDKNAIMVASRILGYGKDYTFNYNGEEVTIDLAEIAPKWIKEEDLVEPHTNEFGYTLPHTNTPVTFKILNNKDEKMIEGEVKGLKKINKQSSAELSTRLKHMLLSVNGDDSKKTIREFVDKYFLARDSRALREHIKEIQPDMDLSFDYYPEDGGDAQLDVKVPIGVTFFWPDA
tara:strand:- start:1965 stop:2759 length:795 start_codon:yes stop_codon:yes gene_type:complete